MYMYVCIYTHTWIHTDICTCVCVGIYKITCSVSPQTQMANATGSFISQSPAYICMLMQINQL